MSKQNFLYKTPVKIAAFILCIIFISSASFITFNALSDLLRQDDDGYDEAKLLIDPIVNLSKLVAEGDDTSAVIKRELSKYDYIDYYINLDGNETYTGGYSKDDFLYDNISAFVAEKNSNGEITINTCLKGDEIPPIDIFNQKYNEYTIGILADYYPYDRQIRELTVIIEDLLPYVSLLLICALALFIYLLCVCGKNANGAIKLLTIDRIYIEFDIIIMLSVVFAGIIWVDTAMYCLFDINTQLTSVIFTSGVGICSSVVLAFVLSFVRNIKNKTFISRFAAVHIATHLLNLFKKYGKRLFTFFINILKRVSVIVKSAVKNISGLFNGSAGKYAFKAILLYTLSGLFGIFLCMATGFGGVIWLLGTFVFTLNIISKRLNDLFKIKECIFELRNGNTAYTPGDVTSETAKDTVQALNTISDGIKNSVERELKAERTKSELITNISHDLKTPLTSIINYTELLANLTLTPEEANDYVKILGQKSQKLKNLSADLFEISKAHSGCEKVELEKIDISLLINQILGENDELIKNSGLEFCTDLPDGVFCTANGKKMSRAIENLITNAVKYSLEKTRVYITVKSDGGKTYITVKNISRNKPDFDADEICERFVRGEKSRTTDGNGLGLAIAKTCVEQCGGTFKITIDGDLFKAEIGV